MSHISVGHILDSVVGRDFEIPCKAMKVIVRDSGPGERPPIFEGPGFFRSNAGGDIDFELLDQMQRTPEQTMATVATIRDGNLGMVVEALAYDGVDWLGGWVAPVVTWHDSGQPTVRGRFRQLSTRIRKTFTDTESQVTELHYGQKLRVPMTRLVEQHTLRGGTVENKASWHDRHEFDFGGVMVRFRHLENPDRTIVSAGFRKGLPPPQAEAWLDETLSFLLGWHVHHRVAVRYFDNDALLFVRKCSVQEKTGMPMPVHLPEQTHAFWRIFECYLTHCENRTVSRHRATCRTCGVKCCSRARARCIRLSSPWSQRLKAWRAS